MKTHSHQFRHAALFYAGDDDYLRTTIPFILGGVEAGDSVLAMVPGRKVDMLREELGDAAGEVMLADMEHVGANPARIIPVWGQFVADRASDGGRVRGIGEPIWHGRCEAELVECQRHEALINVAFDEDTPMDLVCPYDERALDPAVLEGALHSHPIVLGEDGALHESVRYEGVDDIARPFGDPLPPAPGDAATMSFGAPHFQSVRRFVARHGAEAGMPAHRLDDLVLAVNELASNSVRHGGGRGLLRIWGDSEAAIAEVSDGGQIHRPLAGRETPQPDQIGGHGLWLVNQVCDLMQMRTFTSGSVVRVHIRKG